MPRYFQICFLVSLLILSGCERDPVIGGVERPDLDLAIIEASDVTKTGHRPKLTYERCAKQPPIVEPIDQKWSCTFGTEVNGARQDCTVVLSVQADDHTTMWKPVIELDPSNGEIRSTLVCKAG